MADIEIMPLGDRLSDEEIDELNAALKELGAPRLPAGSDDGTTTVSDGIDDDVLAELMDRLEVHDIACDIYLPIEFDGRVEVANVRVGSAPQLVEMLDELRDEMFTDDDDDDDAAEDADDLVEEDEAMILEGKLRHLFKLLYKGAQAAVDRHLPLHIKA